MRGKKINELIRPGTGERLSFKTKSYFCYSDGRIWNHRLRRFVKQHEIGGYKKVDLFSDEGEKCSSIGVHDIVASVFIRPLENGVHVHHKNHVRSDNRVENLQIIESGEHSKMHILESWKSGRMDGVSEKLKKAWSDGLMNGVAAKVSEKMKKAWATGAYEGNGEKVAAKLRNVGTSRHAKQVAQLTKDGRLIKVWQSTAECRRQGFSQGAVSDCCRNCFNSPGNNVYKGYRWQYLECYLAQQPTAREQFSARQLFFDFTE